jgi:hypothetical protein
MGQPVILSDALILDARIAAGAEQRSIAGQVEFWARLGRSIEPMLDGPRVLKLMLEGEAKPLSELLNSMETPEGKARAKAYLKSLPFPHFEQYSTSPMLYIKIDEDGTRSVGSFVDSQWIVSEPETRSLPSIKIEK